MTSGFLRIVTIFGLLTLAACASDQDQHPLPTPSAARGGVLPPGVMPERVVAVALPPVPAAPPQETAAPLAQVAPAITVPVVPPAAEPIPTPAPIAEAAPAPSEPAPALPAAAPQPDEAPAPQAAPVPAVSAIATIAETESPRDYILGIGDEIRLTVYGEDDLSGTYKIGSTGMVSLPLIGNVEADGRTVGAFESAVRTILADGYLKDPRVSVQVATYRPFFILGEVAKPGSYPYVNGMTVLNAVALAGGYTYRADKDDVKTVHAGDPHKTENDAKEDTAIMPGDVIRVPERFF